MGYPDLGLLSLSEIVDRLANIVEHAGVPVIADADTGYGNALNTQRAVREFERAGVAALHLEDQTFPKRCGHYDDQSVISASEIAQKLRAAIRAMDDVLAALARDGSSAALADRMVTFKEREDIVDTAGWLARAAKYGG